MSKKRTPKLRPRPPVVEGLEQRAMLAGDVTAVRRGGTLRLRGGNGNDAVVVEGTTASYRLVQADTGNQSTDGDDFVRIRAVNIIDSRGRQTGAIVVNTLTGDDSIVLADDSALAIILNAGVGGTR